MFDMAGQRACYDRHHVLLHGERMVCVLVTDLRQKLDYPSLDIDDEAEHQLLQRVWRMDREHEEALTSLGDLTSVCQMMATDPAFAANRPELTALSVRLSKSKITVGHRLLYWLKH